MCIYALRFWNLETNALLTLLKFFVLKSIFKLSDETDRKIVYKSKILVFIYKRFYGILNK